MLAAGRAAIKLSLALRAMESGPARLHDASDGSLATLADTRLALTIVDGEIVLEIPQFTVGLAVISQA